MAACYTKRFLKKKNNKEGHYERECYKNLSEDKNKVYLLLCNAKSIYIYIYIYVYINTS